KFGLRLEGFLDRGQIAHVNEVGFKSPAQKNFVKQARCAVVGIDVGDYVIAGMQCLKDRHRRAHSGSERGRAGSAFERRNSFLERLTIWIVVARIHESAGVSSFHVSFEGSREMNRR